MYRAVLDTCALVPGLQRDFLLQLAAEESYSPLWGSGILFELDYVLKALDEARGRSDSEARRRHLFEQMRQAFPGAEIEAPKSGQYDYQLKDADDGHVVHAALMGKADAIITADQRAGFEMSPVLLAAEIEVVTPSTFAANTVAAHPAAGLRAIQTVAGRRRNPPVTPRHMLRQLRDLCGMAEVYELLRAQL